MSFKIDNLSHEQYRMERFHEAKMPEIIRCFSRCKPGQSFGVITNYLADNYSQSVRQALIKAGNDSRTISIAVIKGDKIRVFKR